MGNVLGFRSSLSAGLARISYRQLDYWASTGVVRPSLLQSAGPGSARIYSYDDVLRLRVVACLVDGRLLSLATVEQAIANLGRYLSDEDDLTAASLVLHRGGPMGVAHSDRELLDWLHSSERVVHVVRLGPLRAALDAAINAAIERNHPGIVSVPETLSPGYQEQALPYAG